VPSVNRCGLTLHAVVVKLRRFFLSDQFAHLPERSIRASS
jgi:hypothetical protein